MKIEELEKALAKMESRNPNIGDNSELLTHSKNALKKIIVDSMFMKEKIKDVSAIKSTDNKSHTWKVTLSNNTFLYY